MFTIFIVASIICIVLGLTIILIVVLHRRCRTVKNLLLCNTVAAMCIYSSFAIVLAAFGFNADELHPPPGCVYQGYFYAVIVAIVCYSYLVQAISSLFFAVLFKYKFLLGWRAHWLLIVGNYIFGFLMPIAPFIFGRAYEFEGESRLCLITTKLFPSSMLLTITSYLIPVNSIAVIYAIIVCKVRQSARRVAVFATDRSTGTNTPHANAATPNLQREMKLMKNVVILVGIFVFAGLPFLMMVLWHATAPFPPPEPFYLLALTDITLFFVVKMLVLFQLNKEIKTIMVQFLRNLLSRDSP